MLVVLVVVDVSGAGVVLVFGPVWVAAVLGEPVVVVVVERECVARARELERVELWWCEPPQAASASTLTAIAATGASTRVIVNDG